MEEEMTLFEQVSEYLNQKNFSKLREVLASENPADLEILFTEIEEKEILLL